MPAIRRFLLALCALAAGCGGGEHGGGAGAGEVGETSAVGHKRVLIVDDARDEPVTEDPDDKRSFLVEVWYPAQGEPVAEGEGDLLIDYEPAEHVDAIKEILRTALEDLPGIYDKVLEERTAARANLPLADGGAFPLILHSHGNNGTRHLAFSRMEDLARRGYVVMAPDHTGMAKWGALPGRLVPYSRAGALYAEDRIEDLRYLIDRAEEIGDGFLAGRVSTDNVGVSGFSAGALSAVFLARAEPRVGAVQAMAAGPTGDEPIDAPLLVVGASHDLAARNLDRLFASGSQDKWYAELVPHGHQAFTNACSWMPTAPGSAGGCAGGVDEAGQEITFLSFEQIRSVLHPITVGFFDRYLRGDGAGTDVIDESLYEGMLTVKSKS